MNTSTKKIIRIKNNSVKEIEDSLAVEKRLRVSINGKELISLYCTPSMIRELVVGLIMTEGIIEGEWCESRMSIEYGDDILVNIRSEGAEISRDGMVITSGCAGGITFAKKPETEKIKDDFSITAKGLFEIFGEFQSRSELYRSTGCVHSAALSDGKYISAFAEDIGRHNAVDKVIGYSLLEDIKFERKIMLASGRLSSEIASKCSKWGIPILASRTAPTDFAVRIAELRGITLIGFVRSDRLNIYTHPERIVQ
ncbi:MAG: formate dehydrogenase accessory sulfurtransferase FdhD [Nitrospirae bacterium]|nr:formate dehydrogenase accessory sulfurtransferase FdhD [Nitrospirota bacterium]